MKKERERNSPAKPYSGGKRMDDDGLGSGLVVEYAKGPRGSWSS